VSQDAPRPRCCGLCADDALEPRHVDILIDDRSRSSPRFRTLYGCDTCRSLWSTLPEGVGSPSYYADKPLSDHLLLESGVRRFDRVRRAVESALGRERYSLLDVGCAAGAHLAIYGPQVEKSGVEPSAAVAEHLGQRGIAWLGRFVEELPPDPRFDVVTCLDVLEHLADPARLLAEMDRRLTPGGLLVLVTGDIGSFSARYAGRRWLYYALPEHCSFFSTASLERHLERKDYRLVRKTWIANQDIDAAYVRAFLRAVARETVLKLLPRSKVRNLERAGRGRFPFFCDNMLLLFRKPLHP
jgi:SAM-dependent methyltransferase